MSRTGNFLQLARAVRRQIMLVLLGILLGVSLCIWSLRAWSATTVVEARLHLALVCIGLVLLALSIVVLVQIVRWLQRAAWVFQSVEPIAMRMSMRPGSLFGLGSEAWVQLAPLNGRSRVNPDREIAVNFARGRPNRRAGTRVMHAVVYVDPRRDGPIVARAEGRVLCTVWQDRKLL